MEKIVGKPYSSSCTLDSTLGCQAYYILTCGISRAVSE